MASITCQIAFRVRRGWVLPLLRVFVRILRPLRRLVGTRADVLFVWLAVRLSGMQINFGGHWEPLTATWQETEERIR